MTLPDPGVTTPPTDEQHDGCDLCMECPGCDGGSGATPSRPFLDRSRPGVVLLKCLDCGSSGYVCPTVQERTCLWAHGPVEELTGAPGLCAVCAADEGDL